MKKIIKLMRSSQKLTITFLLSLASLTANARDAGSFDGIYSTNPDIGYIYIRENAGTIVAVLNETIDGPFYWEAAMGPISFDANSINPFYAVVNSIIGITKTSIKIEFTPNNTFIGTQLSCVPEPGYYCLFPDGAQVVGTKIW